MGETIAKRLYWLRKVHFNLSRAKFGEPIGMTDSEIKNIEYGLTEIREVMIRPLCAYYGVNEHWFRTGEGDPFLPVSRQEEIGAIAADAAECDPEEARRFFIDLIGDESDARILLLYKLFRDKYGKA